ncbi:SRPBCC domain-containing protein [Cohnella sp. REN36]|uniref:SRPBCC domain-containing protein n=1 Tax=Cohnella sp. REN36 TaxID=2887347 RepID=UPI001D13F05E|nr:SRPBCC domain-containing protein [Cohnella sp. REN36]
MGYLSELSNEFRHWLTSISLRITKRRISESRLRVGGKFLTRMEAKDGSMGFDFGGVYDVVNRHEAIGYTMEDGRRVDIAFVDQGNETKVIETSDAESSNPVEFQQAGWQTIMDNFKAYTEQN